MIEDIFMQVACEFFGENFIDFRNESAHLWNEFDETLWHQDNTVVLFKLRSLDDDVGDVSCDLRERHFFLGDFFANKY